MKVIRNGKVEEVKRLKVGDKYLGECWLCEQRCELELLSNGHSRHFPVTHKELLGVKDVPLASDLRVRAAKSLDWMIRFFDWQNEQTGCHTDDSPELTEAKELLQELKL